MLLCRVRSPVRQTPKGQVHWRREDDPNALPRDFGDHELIAELGTGSQEVVYLAQLLRHPNLVWVLDVGRVEERPFVALERVDGCSALARLPRARRHGGLWRALERRDGGLGCRPRAARRCAGVFRDLCGGLKGRGGPPGGRASDSSTATHTRATTARRQP